MRFPWKYVAVATAFYTFIYFICRRWLVKDQVPEFSNRIATLIHGILAIGLSIYCCLKVGPFPFTSAIALPLTPLQTLAFSNSLGYFIFDFYWCLFHSNEGIVMLSHHIVSIASLTRVLHAARNGSEYMAGLGLLESSNPLLQLRWFLRTLGYHNNIPFYIVEWLFITQFALVRIVFGTYILPRMLKLQGPMREYLYEFIAMYIISIAFFVGMLHFVWKKYIKPSFGQEDLQSGIPRDSVID